MTGRPVRAGTRQIDGAEALSPATGDDAKPLWRREENIGGLELRQVISLGKLHVRRLWRVLAVLVSTGAQELRINLAARLVCRCERIGGRVRGRHD